MTRFINVFITDGNRLCSYDCKKNQTLEELLRERKFHAVKGSIRVNGCSLPDSRRTETLEELQKLTLIGRPMTDHMRIGCRTPDDDPLKQREKPARKKTEEAADDVR